VKSGDVSYQGEREKRRGEPPGGPAARAAWFYGSRTDREGKVLSGLWARAVDQRRQLEVAAFDGAGTRPPDLPAGTPGGPGSVNWTPIGPSVVLGGLGEAGRITALAAGPSGTRVYAGAANGGVWRSDDGGGSWAPLNDYITSPTTTIGSEDDALAVGALAVKFAPSGDDVFVGTGENAGNYDAYFGIGIRHFSGGAWTLEATNLADAGIYEIVIDPDDTTPTHVFAATTKGLFRRPTSGSMATWTLVTSTAFTNASGAVSSIVAAGLGAAKRFYAAFAWDQVYSSPDGAAWTALTGLAGNGRIALGIAESSPGIVYALCQDGTLNRLSGTSFSTVTGLPANVLFSGGQGWYDIAIAVDPTNPATIFLGGDRLRVFKGTVTGSPGSFVFPFNPANTMSPTADPTWVGANVHSDVHAIVFGMNAAGTAHDPATVFVGSDGGVYASTASGDAGTFSSRNVGLAITEFAYLAQRADTDAVVFAGAQDNGTPRIFGEQACSELAGGDGGGVVYDPRDAYRVMRQYVYGIFEATTDGGATWSGVHFPPTTAATTAQSDAASAESGSAGFVAPLAAFDTGSSTLAAAGTNRLWLTSDWGTSWVTLPTNTNPYVPATPNATQDVLAGSADPPSSPLKGIRAIAFASATRIFAATATYVYRFDLTGSAWTSTQITNTGLPPHVFTALAVENAATGTFYATLGGGGVAHAYYFDGSAWHAALPTSVVDVPSHAVVVDSANPSNVYVGTDVGCWKGVKGAGPTWTWSVYSQGLPEAAITDLAIHQPARLLRAATHGRGVWEIDLAATSGSDPDVYMRANYNDTGRIAGGTRHAWIENHLDPTHVGYSLYHYMSADIKVRRSGLMGLPALGTPVNYADFAVNIGDFVDPATRIETADRTGTDRIFVEVHNRSLNAVPASQVQVLLLAADAAVGVPALPGDYATRITSADTSGWLAGTGWRFVDTMTPYRTIIADLDVRTPQVVEYSLDFSTLGLPSTHDHVCLAAFVTAAGDQLTSISTSVDQLAMVDKHVAQRNTHLVTVPMGGGTVPGQSAGASPQTVLVDVHNAHAKETVADLVFDCTHFPGRLAVALPKHIAFADRDVALEEFHTVATTAQPQSQGGVFDVLHRSVGAWLEKLEDEIERIGEAIEDFFEGPEDEAKQRRHVKKLASIDRTRSYVAKSGSARPTIRGVRLGPHAALTLSFTLEVPPNAAPGDKYRLDVIQRRGTVIAGGCGYVIAVTNS